MAVNNLTNQYLTFQLGAETFALSIANVREVLKLPDLTAIPGAPDFIRGVINVRGSVVPVVDLKRKFGQPLTEKSRRTRVVIVESVLRESRIVLGALADSVDEVIELQENQIEPPPEVGLGIKTDFIQGIGKVEERFLILLDVGKVFSESELILAEKSAASPLART